MPQKRKQVSKVAESKTAPDVEEIKQTVEAVEAPIERPEDVKEAAQEPVNLTPWTVDIREDYRDGEFKSTLSEKDLDELYEDYKSRGYAIDQIYCTQEQAKVIKKHRNVALTIQ